MNKSSDILNLAKKLCDNGEKIALGTVIETWGSSPRPVGSQILIKEDGNFVGSVSGGCIEGEVISEGINAIQTNKSKVIDYGITNTTAWNNGLACGGKIKIFIEPLK
ncbi:XdhC family protein [Alphaproteobacteria bacterium]|nr:XdhC family protein [Alphaproteobacteria bacterium]